MKPEAWAGSKGRYTFDEIDHHIQFRMDAIRCSTQRMLTEETPLIDFPAAIAWQSEQLQDLLTTKQMMEKSNECTN